MNGIEDFLKVIEDGKKATEEKDIGGKFLKDLANRIVPAPRL